MNGILEVEFSLLTISSIAHLNTRGFNFPLSS